MPRHLLRSTPYVLRKLKDIHAHCTLQLSPVPRSQVGEALRQAERQRGRGTGVNR